MEHGNEAIAKCKSNNNTDETRTITRNKCNLHFHAMLFLNFLQQASLVLTMSTGPLSF